VQEEPIRMQEELVKRNTLNLKPNACIHKSSHIMSKNTLLTFVAQQDPLPSSYYIFIFKISVQKVVYVRQY